MAVTVKRRKRSVRTMLTLWNTVTFAVVLVVLGVVFRYLARGYMLTGLDREMSAQSERMVGASSTKHLFIARDRSSESVSIHVVTRNMGIAEKFPPIPGLPDTPVETTSHVEMIKNLGAVVDGASGQFLYRSFDVDGKPMAGAGAMSKIRFVTTTSNVMLTDGVEPEQYRPWDSDGLHEAVREGKVQFTTVQSDGAPMRIMSSPIRGENNAIIGVGQIAAPLTPVYRDIAGLTRTLFWILPPALLIAGLAGVFLTGRALRPVQTLTQAARRIRPDQLAQRLPLNGSDEFDELAETFNRALSRVELAFDERERMMEQLRRFTGDASHELRTPLTTIKVNTGVALAESEPAPEHVHALRQIDKAANRMTALVDDLLLLARFDGGQLPIQMRELSIASIVAEAVDILPGQSDQPHIDVTGCPTTLMVQGDQEQLIRLFRNLLENAVRYTPADGAITVAARPQSPNRVEITVTDTGSGIPAEHLPHLGERLYRADTGRNRMQGGSGLGLAICRSIAERHEGEISFQSEPGKGTVVTVFLPASMNLAPTA